MARRGALRRNLAAPSVVATVALPVATRHEELMETLSDYFRVMGADELGIVAGWTQCEDTMLLSAPLSRWLASGVEHEIERRGRSVGEFPDPPLTTYRYRQLTGGLRLLAMCLRLSDSNSVVSDLLLELHELLTLELGTRICDALEKNDG
jgi:hypothetical protein